jgi:hypothetical protein
MTLERRGCAVHVGDVLDADSLPPALATAQLAAGTAHQDHGRTSDGRVRHVADVGCSDCCFRLLKSNTRSNRDQPSAERIGP